MIRLIGVSFLVRALGVMAVMIMSFGVARLLPVEQSGYFFLAFSVLSIFSQVGVFGANVTGLKRSGAAWARKDRAGVQQIFVSGFVLVLISGGVTALALYVAAPVLADQFWHKPAMGPVLERAAWFVVLNSLGFFIAFQLQAVGRVIASVIVLSITIPLGTVCATATAGLGTAMGVVNGLLGAAFFNLVLGLWFWNRYLGRPAWVRPDFSGFLSSCVPVWVTAVLGALTQWGGQFIAAAWVTPQALAQLAAAQRVAAGVSFILIAVNLVTAPKFAALYDQKDMAGFRALSVKTVRLMAAVSIPLGGGLMLFARPVMALFGPEFAAGAPLLVVLVLGQWVNVVCGSVGYMLNMSGHERDMRNVILISSPLFLVLALVLSRYYGVMGAAAATSVGLAVQNLGAVWCVKKRLGFNSLNVIRP